jgi:hypothetical protein
MHFINKKLATGLDAPLELLPEMVPPTLRVKPVLIEEAHISKEFEELQTQVTELQREKLYYEQRASEHEISTKQKRTELSNLELEMESVFKTLQEREIDKSSEKKKFVEFDDRLTKLISQLNDFKTKYDSELELIEKLKLQISHMDNAFKSKDIDLIKIKNDLLLTINEQLQLENRFKSRKECLSNLTQESETVNEEIDQVNYIIVKN